MEIKKALSIKNPWGFLCAIGVKDIENRTWRTNFIGRIYIHVSGQIYPFFNGENLAFTYNQWEAINKKIDVHKKKEHDKFFLTSAIIGEVEIIDCVQNHPSIWAEKAAPGEKPIWNWVLANPVLYDKPILNVKGKLSFWEYEKPEESEFCECSEPHQSIFPDGNYRCTNEGCFKVWYH